MTESTWTSRLAAAGSEIEPVLDQIAYEAEVFLLRGTRPAVGDCAIGSAIVAIAMSHPAERVRVTAIESLNWIHMLCGGVDFDQIEGLLRRSTSSFEIIACLELLGSSENPIYRDVIQEYTNSTDPDVRRVALQELVWLP